LAFDTSPRPPTCAKATHIGGFGDGGGAGGEGVPCFDADDDDDAIWWWELRRRFCDVTTTTATAANSLFFSLF